MISSYTLDSVLMMAAKEKKYSLMKSYLEKGATCRLRDNSNPNGNTVMHAAIVNRDEKMLDLLLNYNIDLSAKNNAGLTPVALAARLGYWDIVVKIVSKRKEGKHDYFEYSQALLLAAQNNDVDMVRVLLLAGAKADARHPVTKDTALHYAVFHRNLRMIRLLMRHDAASDHWNAQDMYPIEYALSLGYWDCVMLIAVMRKRDANSMYGRILFEALREKHYQFAPALLAAGAWPKFKNLEGGETVLHLAVKANLPWLIALLMKYKADADEPNSQDENPLFLAHKLQHWECADAFINPEKYLPLSESALQKKLFYLFAAHKNKANPFSAIPYDVLKIIFKHGFSDYPDKAFDFNESRRRYENFREERHFIGSVSFFVQAYQSYSLLRQWTTGQSPDSIAFVEALNDIIHSGDVLTGQVAAVKTEINKFTALKGEEKSRAMDLLKYYKLFTPAKNAAQDKNVQQKTLKRG